MSVVKVEKNSYTVESLYQWDLNQVLTIYGLSLPSIPEIHFTNDAMDRAIVRQASMDSAGVITADVPNSLLQKAGKMKVYVCIYQGDTFTSLYKIEIQVKARNKPSDYTLVDDPEVYSFNALENQVVNALTRVNSLSSDAISKYNGASAALTEAKTAYENAKDDVDEAVDNAVDTAMNNIMPTLLSDATKTKFGFGTEAVPNDVFSYLGNYAKYWWQRKALTSITKYLEANVYFETKYECDYFQINTNVGTLYVADSVTFDEDTGEYALNNPTTYAAGQSYPYTYTGMYLYSPDGRISKSNSEDDLGVITDILYINDYSMASSYSGVTIYRAKNVSVLGSESYRIDTGGYSYVSSTDRNAYPDSGSDSDFSYEYLGIPFDKAVTAPRVATGSYTGTGTYGSSNKNSLTFDFVPKFLVVTQNGKVTAYSGGSFYWVSPSTGSVGVTDSNDDYTPFVSVNGNTVSWYDDSSAGDQFNVSGIKYHYIAIG